MASFGLSCDNLFEDKVKKLSFRCLAWFFLLWLAPCCFAQVIRIRVVDSKTGLPLQKQPVSVGLFYEKGKKAPAGFDTRPRLETNVNGEAEFRLPDPVPAHLGIQVRLTSEHWHCWCVVLVATQDLLRTGIVESADVETKASAAAAKAEPGVILFRARPFTFLERLLYPLVKE